MKELINDIDLLNDKMPMNECLFDKTEPIGPELKGHKWFSEDYSKKK